MYCTSDRCTAFGAEDMNCQKLMLKCNARRGWLFTGNNCDGQPQWKCFDSTYRFDYKKATEPQVYIIEEPILTDAELQLLYLAHPSCRG